MAVTVDLQAVRRLVGRRGRAEARRLFLELLDRERFAARYIRHPRSGRPWECRPYQRASLRSFAPRKVHQDGRDVGKTTEIEIAVLWAVAMLPHRQVLVATQRLNQLYPLMERIVRRLTTLEPFRSLLVSKTRSPSYHLRFRNGFELWGRIAGPRGTNFNGMHVDWVLVDEAQEMTDEAWTELYQALNAGGWRWVYGVPNGRRNTYYRLTQMAEYEQYRWPATLNPEFSEEKRLELVKLYGGEDSPGYVHQVLGEHGSPEHAAFNFEDYVACVDEALECVELKLGAAELKRYSVEKLLEPCRGVAGEGAYYLGCDLGYTRDPTELVVYRTEGELLVNVARVHLRGVDYWTQQSVIVALDDVFHFAGVGIDMGANGAAVCHNLQAIDARWAELVRGVSFQSNLHVGYLADGREDVRPAKRFMTGLIEERMRKRTIVFPPLEDRERQYINHTYRLGPDERIVYSKGDDHLIDADRCALLRHFLDAGSPLPPRAEDPGAALAAFELRDL